jgi:hypothetical protein
MALLTVQKPTLAGVAPSYAAAGAGGDTFAPDDDGLYMLHVKNAHTGSWTVTIDDPTTVSPVNPVAFNPDVAVAVPNATERIIMLDAKRFRNKTTGLVSLTYTGVTALTVGVFKVR